MPRTKEAYEEIRAARKEQILQAAARVFSSKGLTDTTVTDIAAAAGVSHGLLYRHFASKEEVFAALVGQALEEAIQLTEFALAQPGTPWERLHWLTRQMYPGQQQLGKRPAYFLVVLHALTNEDIPGQVRELAARPGEIMYDVLRQFIVEGQEVREVVGGDPDQLATLYLSCIQGLVLRATYTKLSLATFPTVETVLHMLQARC